MWKKQGVARTAIVVIIIVIIIIIAAGAYALVGLSPSSTSTQSQSTSSTSGGGVTSSSTVQNSTVTSSSSSTQSKTTTTSSSSNSAQYGGTLTIDVQSDNGAPGDPANVRLTGGSIPATVVNEVYEGLTAIDFQSNVVPALAVNWTVVSPTDYRFNLRQGVLFQDGTQFNASAVVFSFDRILNNTKLLRYGQVADIANVTALSNFQVEFKLLQPSTDFLPSLAIGEGIISPSAYIKAGSAWGTSVAVGTGPYEFVQWVQNDHTTLQANPNYWGPKPYIQTIVLKVVPDPSVSALQLQTGQAQLAVLSPQEAQRLNSTTGVHVDVGLPNYFTTFSIDVDPNYTIAPLLNPLVRQAINYAVNRSAITQYVELGYAQPAIGPIPPAIQQAWNPSLQLYPFDGNVTKAKQLLAQAGYPRGFNVVVDTAPFTTDYLQVAQVFVQDLQAIGINATINQMTIPGFSAVALSGNGTWSIAFHSWSGQGIPSANGMMGQFYNSADIGYFKWNVQHIRDANLTNMLNELAVANASQVFALSNAIQTRVLTQGYGVILYYPDVLQGVTNNFNGYRIHPNPLLGYVIFSPEIGAKSWLSSSTSSGAIAGPMLDTMFGTAMSALLSSVFIAASLGLLPKSSRSRWPTASAFSL